MEQSGCNHKEFASAVKFSDAKRAGGPVSTDGGFDPGMAIARAATGMSYVANGVMPGGQKNAY